jgi:hypothetical protein
MNVLSSLNIVSSNYYSASFGSLDFASVDPSGLKILTEDIINGKNFFCLVFNHYSDNSSGLRANDYNIDGYYVIDENLDIVLNFNDIGLRPENQGIAKLQDERFAYLKDPN